MYLLYFPTAVSLQDVYSKNEQELGVDWEKRRILDEVFQLNQESGFKFSRTAYLIFSSYFTFGHFWYRSAEAVDLFIITAFVIRSHHSRRL